MRRLRELDDSLRDEDRRQDFARSLAELHELATQMPVQLLTIAEADQVELVADSALDLWAEQAGDTPRPVFKPDPVRQRRQEMWVGNTQVNFCARAYPTVSVQHADAAPLTVLGGFLRNGFLHRTIREQGGAYGGGASQDSGIAAFRFYSYRDPRLAETLQDFDQSVNWLLETPHEYRAVEEAILGVIGSIDKPSSPAGEAKQHFHNRLFGRTHAQREHFREQILAVTLDDLRRVTETYLRPELASTAVITNSSGRQGSDALLEELAMQVEEL